MTGVVKKASDEFAMVLRDNLKSIKSVLPAHMDEAKFCRMSINNLMKNPALAKCSKESFLMSVMNLGESGLDTSLGQAALIPYKGTCTVQIMYQGLIELARRSGQISTIDAEVVRDGDDFEYSRGLDPVLKHTPASESTGALLYVYAVAQMKDGGKQFVVLSKTDVMKIKGAAQGTEGASSPWKKWEEAMWRKTALKQLCKLLPKSAEMAKAISLDDQEAAGKIQLPDMADMSESTVDVDKLASANVEPEEGITKPRAKGEEQSEDEAVAELKAIEDKIGVEVFEECRSRAGVDEAEVPEMMGLVKVKELLSLYKARL